jgi:hypothetical protein
LGVGDVKKPKKIKVPMMKKMEPKGMMPMPKKKGK